MKKGVIIGIIVAIVIVAIVVGYIVLQSGKDSGGSARGSDTTSTTASALAGCLSPLNAEKLPGSLGGFSGTAMEVTKPYSWTGPDGAKSSMTLTKGYGSIYTASGGKMLIAQVVKFKNSEDYDKIKSDMEILKRDAQVGVITKTSVNEAETYLWDISDTKSVSYYIFAGDNTFTVFMFTGLTATEAQAWVDEWKTSIC